jgi:CheY-like chemotaxis protein
MDCKKKILVIDDEPDILAVLRARLQKNNYAVVTSLDGASGILLARQEKPDLIILDVLMPGMSGWEVCEKLKKSEETRNIPIIFLTASCPELHKIRALILGAEHFLTKPFEPDRLLGLVGKVIGQENSEIKIDYKEEVFEQIQKKFIARAEHIIETIYEALSSLPPDYDKVYRLSHSLRGTSGTLCFNDLSEASAKVLDYVGSVEDKKDISFRRVKVMIDDLKEKIPVTPLNSRKI